MRLALVVLLAGCAHAGIATVETTPAPGVHQTERQVRYAVHGGTVDALRAEMTRIGPIDDGGHQFAHTWGNYAWHWPYAREAAGCRTGPVAVELEIVQTFPVWDRAGASATAQAWDRWLAATQVHEDGHKRILVDTARALVERLAALPAAADCAALDRAANTLGNQLLDEMRNQHAEFDRTTEHGARTGAILR